MTSKPSHLVHALQSNSNWLAFLNWVYPHLCYLCGKKLAYDLKEHLCVSCSANIEPISTLSCQRCGLPLPDGGMHCYHCKVEKLARPIIRSFGPFDGALKTLIHHFKYRQKTFLAYDLSLRLEAAWRRYPEIQTSQILMPVPLHRSAFRERTYNQSELLANELSIQLSLPSLSNLLTRRKKTESQTKLDRTQRAQNVQAAFSVENPKLIEDKEILLLDDVCTTGATLAECASTLMKAGAKNVSCLTMARD